MKKYSINNSFITFKFLVLMLFFSWSAPIYAQTEATVKKAMTAMLKHYTDKPAMSVEYLIAIYENKDDESPSESTTMSIWIEEKDMYYCYESYEYFQNKMGSVWLDHNDKAARYLPIAKEEKPTNSPQNPNLKDQLEMMMAVCDTIIYEGKNKGKNKYSIQLSYGTYKKVELLLNTDYSIYKTIYYYQEKAYGYKSETTVHDLTDQQLSEIKNKFSPVRKAMLNNSIETHFKNYQFLEID